MILNKHAQQLALGTCILLACLACLTLGYDLRQWHKDWQLAHQPLTNTEFKAQRIAHINLESIPNAHLFGRPAAKITEVPISSLHLEITGIVKVEQNDHESKVYLSTAGQPSKIYHTGDIVTQGVKIYSISPDTVILENNGQFEKLPLKRDPLQFKPLIKKE